jgi:predicted regulator of Ras-like GTPase activity (Roadblock/LC7/MglB family)
MTGATEQDDRQASRFSWLIDSFADNVDGVAHAVVISVDGLLLTASAQLPTDRADEMAAISAGIISLNLSASKTFDAGEVLRTIVQMDEGALLLTSIRDAACLVVLAEGDCDISQVAYEMTVLVDQVGQILTPQLRATLAAG